MWVSVDVEADGPIPGDYSMVSLGAVVVEPSLSRRFYAQLRPVSERYQKNALEVCGFSREQTLSFEEPLKVLNSFSEWLHAEGGVHLFFVSDNGFDWQYVNWYYHHFLGANPFGYNSLNLLSLYGGLVRNVYTRFKHKKKYHIHNSLQDAIYNAELLLQMKEDFGLKINW